MKFCIFAFIFFKNFSTHSSFEFTNRYQEGLFGNTSKRTQEMGTRMYLAHVAAIPGGGVCRKIFKENECKYTEFHQSDLVYREELPKLLRDVPQDQISQEIFKLTMQRFMRNPLQYFFLSGLESFKMGFWETTRMGFVIYPPKLEGLFAKGLIRYGVRFMASVITYLALVVVFFQFVMNRSFLTDLTSLKGRRVQMEAFVLTIIIGFTALYSLFSILTRYALPIVPLYIICIALFLQSLFFNRK